MPGRSGPAGASSTCRRSARPTADLLASQAFDITLEITKAPAQQVEILQRAAVLTAEAMPQLRKPGDLREYWIEINRLENEADRVYRRLLATLFSGEFDALTVLKLKGVVHALELAADHFEHVANAIEQIALKES